MSSKYLSSSIVTHDQTSGLDPWRVSRHASASVVIPSLPATTLPRELLDLDPETAGDDHITESAMFRYGHWGESAASTASTSTTKVPQQRPGLEIFIKKLRNETISGSDIEQILDDLFLHEDLREDQVEAALFELLNDRRLLRPILVLNVLNAFADYDVDIRRSSSLDVVKNCLNDESSYVAVAAAQALLSSVHGGKRMFSNHLAQEGIPHRAFLLELKRYNENHGE